MVDLNFKKIELEKEILKELSKISE